MHYKQLKKEDSGTWIPDVDKGECGEDLKTQFIVCDDEDGCTATRNEFPYMVFKSYGITSHLYKFSKLQCPITLIYRPF